MNQKEKIRMAYNLKTENQEIETPINDIIDCIEQMESTGVPEDNLESIVKSTVLSPESSTYPNEPRYPRESEILIYSVPESLSETFIDPR